jgi:hypothetical protein
MGRELTAHFRYFDRLIDEGVFQPECGYLQREALADAPCLDPMRLVVARRYEYGDAGRAAQLLRVFVVLALLGKDERQQQASQPRRNRGIAGNSCGQAVLRRESGSVIETDPGLELAHEIRIPHLHRVALNDVLEDILDLRPIGNHKNGDSVPSPRLLKQSQLLACQRPTIVLRARAPAARNGFEQVRAPGLGRLQCDLDRVGRVRTKTARGLVPERGRRVDEVLRGASKAGEKVMIVGIDGRTPTREIRENRDAILLDLERPRLRVVAIGRERRVANQFAQAAIGAHRRPRRRSGFVISHCIARERNIRRDGRCRR